MSKLRTVAHLFLVVVVLAGGAWIGNLILNHQPSAAQSTGHGEAATVQEEKGPHRGRLLRDGDFAVEITIFERNVPPHFRVYAYHKDKPVDPRSVQLRMELIRLGGRVDHFLFRPEADYLTGEGVVREPHSFEVKVSAAFMDKEHAWAYESFEGRTTINAKAAKDAGMESDVAGPASLRDIVLATGRIAVNLESFAKVEARFPGLVREVRKGIGDRVAAGEPLATIESNESLQAYVIRSPINGIVMARSTNAGALAGVSPLFEIADLSTVWAELNVFTRDVGKVRPGQRVTIRASDGSEADGIIDRLQPVADPLSQTVIARVTLNNREGRWRPGRMITGEVTVSIRNVPLAVKTSGLQRFRDFTVVFGQVGETYEVRMLELGQRDRDMVEVLGGLEPGERYVTENSFLVKADVEKSGASHDH